MNKRIWFPEYHQLHPLTKGRNPNYLHSVFLGLTAPVLCLPILLWKSWLRPVLAMTIMALSSLVSYVVMLPICGLLGKLDARKVTEHDVLREAIADLRSGNG